MDFRKYKYVKDYKCFLFQRFYNNINILNHSAPAIYDNMIMKLVCFYATFLI